jgi:hypothetical protein
MGTRRRWRLNKGRLLGNAWNGSSENRTHRLPVTRSTNRMDRRKFRLSTSSYLLAGPLLSAMLLGAMGTVQAQTSGQANTPPPQGGAAAAQGGVRPGAKDDKGAKPKNEPSEAYRESIRRTVERRRERRAGRGSGDSRPVGGIVPWPMPPVLVIRHTPQVHDEIDSFLRLLRK